MAWSKVYLLAALAVVPLLLAGCALGEIEACPEGYDLNIEFQLFFGLTDNDGNTVSEEEWQDFLQDTVIPYFPAGSSVVEVDGHWKHPSGNLQNERAKKVHGLMAPPSDDGWLRVEKISEEFVQRFNQDPVFHIAQEVCSGISE